MASRVEGDEGKEARGGEASRWGVGLPRLYCKAESLSAAICPFTKIFFK